MQDSTHDISDWGEPLLLEERTLLPWPKECFPEILENFVNELARSTETPVELSAMLALSVIATASQKKYQVQVKEGYCEPTNLWTVGILPPASRKSSVYKAITISLKSWEREQKIAIEPLIKSTESSRKTMEARLKCLRLLAGKTSSETEYEKLQKQIEELETKLPIILKHPQIWASDVTNEQLGVIMGDNGEAMSLLSDEGGIFDIISGLYSDGRSNIDLLLQAHTGTSVRVDRGSRPPIFMERAILTMGLTVQPEVVKKICGNKTYRGRGLLGRFLYVIPKSNIGTRTLDVASMSSDCSERFHNLVTSILHHSAPNSNELQNLYTLKLTEDAYKKWLEYAQCIESLMGEEIGYLSHISDWAGKLAGAIARIAGLLHIVRHANERPWESLICAQDISSAIKIGHTLTSHALVVFDILQEDDAMNLARSIYHWIKQKKLEKFTLRICKKKNQKLKETEIKAALHILEEKEIVRNCPQIKCVGRRSEIYSVNPGLLKDK